MIATCPAFSMLIELGGRGPQPGRARRRSRSGCRQVDPAPSASPALLRGSGPVESRAITEVFADCSSASSASRSVTWSASQRASVSSVVQGARRGRVRPDHQGRLGAQAGGAQQPDRLVPGRRPGTDPDAVGDFGRESRRTDRQRHRISRHRRDPQGDPTGQCRRAGAARHRAGSERPLVAAHFRASARRSSRPAALPLRSRFRTARW